MDVEVVIVGAGLAGLRCAQVLEERGREVVVLERSSDVGGRLASRVVDGYVIDEGFQLVNPAYPELVASGVLSDLDARPFERSLRVTTSGGVVDLVDPRRSPGRALAALRELAPLSDLVRVGAVAARAALEPVGAIRRRADRSTAAALRALGVGPALVEGVLQPFLRGTLLEDDLASSWRYVQLLLRSFARGIPVTFPTGVAALPRALAGRLRRTEVHRGEAATSVAPTRVVTERAEYRARHVVVAVDASRAREWVGTPDLGWRSQTAWWFAAPRVAYGGRLRLDATQSLVTSVLDLAGPAPERAPAGRSLLAASANGVAAAASEPRAREVVARAYGLATSDLDLVTTTTVARALPVTSVPLALSRPARVGEFVVAGDHLQTPSIQGALVSGRRAATAVTSSR